MVNKLIRVDEIIWRGRGREREREREREKERGLSPRVQQHGEVRERRKKQPRSQKRASDSGGRKARRM